MITAATQRVIFRWLHIVLAIPIIGYVYSPFEQLPDYAPVVRFVAIPVLVLTGLWMWKGHLVRRLFSRSSAGRDVANSAQQREQFQKSRAISPHRT